ncbi:MAG TPA: amidohydrolase/deacetylase family metallohydrolase [Hanamia sp.]|nr:amidohydrolase/deacetylase family metallohydrolase [Hanamia sp.]
MFNIKRSFNSKIKHACIFIFLFVCLVPSISNAQEIDILLKGGHVIDPKNNIDSKMDVAIVDGKIFEVAPDISAKDAKKVVDVSGLYVTPGLINIHTHIFVGSKDGFADGWDSVDPDAFSFRSGVTTMVDAGTSGWRNFPLFKKNVIDRSKTRVLSFLDIFDFGFSSGSPEMHDTTTMNARMTCETIKKYSGIIVGVCVGHYSGSDWMPFTKAIEAASCSSVPILVETDMPKLSLEGQLSHLRPGDILTDTYEDVHERMSVVDEKGKVRPFVLDAQKRGILFDAGHGGAGFWFSQAMPALKQGLLPNSFGTDLHRFSMNAGMKNILNLMSKFLNMGMSLQAVMARAAWYPAMSIKREDLGNLSVGAVADVAVLNLLHGKFGFVDAGNNKMDGTRKFQAELTIRAGKIVYDLNGISAKKFQNK